LPPFAGSPSCAWPEPRISPIVSSLVGGWAGPSSAARCLHPWRAARAPYQAARRLARKAHHILPGETARPSAPSYAQLAGILTPKDKGYVPPVFIGRLRSFLSLATSRSLDETGSISGKLRMLGPRGAFGAAEGKGR
jgi:hypothetical protein